MILKLMRLILWVAIVDIKNQMLFHAKLKMSVFSVGSALLGFRKSEIDSNFTRL
jgi:hypothetical protein